MNINNIVTAYIKTGYSHADAVSKAAQDIILLKISSSSLSHNVTIKGGVVMHDISKDARRATRDMDIDFIKYSLENTSIYKFIDKLNNVKDGIEIKIVGKIKELKHQDYNGKRVNIKLIDKNKYTIETKLDIGVHKNLDIVQNEYTFDLKAINQKAVIMINPLEQIFVEKLKSLLIFSFTTTRYKDIFDFCYLIKYSKLNMKKVEKLVQKIIFNSKYTKVNDFSDILNTLVLVFNDKSFKSKIQNNKVNWLNISYEEVTSTILDYIKKIIKITI